MKIGLIGYGKMGKSIEKIALQRGHEISAIIDPEFGQEFTEASEADVFIDFSTPDVCMNNIKKACELKKNVVMGTTGWYEQMDEVKHWVEQSGIAFLWGSNFSLAVNTFFLVLEEAARIAGAFEDCDPAIIELHHRHKKDAPSGTALTLAEIIMKHVKRKKKLQLNMPAGKIDPEELHLATVRVGEVPGTHKVLFDFPDETLELSSLSRSRAGFALGAVLAAEWLDGKKGFWEFREIFKTMAGK